MTNISLDKQEFFWPSAPAGEKSRSHSRCPRTEDPSIASPEAQNTLLQDIHYSQHGPPARSLVDVIELSSDDEWDYGDLGENGSDTSSPRIDELFPHVTRQSKSDSFAETGKSFNSACDGGSDSREPSVTETAGLNNQRSEPLPIAAVYSGLASEGVRDGSGLPPFAGTSRAATSSRSQAPGTVDAVASASPFSHGILTAPTSAGADLTHGVEGSLEACLAQTTEAAQETSFQNAAKDSKKVLVGQYGSGSDRDPSSSASPREKHWLREYSLHPDSASQDEEWDRVYPLSPQVSRNRPYYRTQLGQQQRRSPEHFSAAPATVVPLRSPGTV